MLVLDVGSGATLALLDMELPCAVVLALEELLEDEGPLLDEDAPVGDPELADEDVGGMLEEEEDVDEGNGTVVPGPPPPEPPGGPSAPASTQLESEEPLIVAGALVAVIPLASRTWITILVPERTSTGAQVKVSNPAGWGSNRLSVACVDAGSGANLAHSGR